MSTGTLKVLSAEEVAFYKGNGYLVPSFRLSSTEVSRLQGQLAKLLADNPHLRNIAFPMAHIASAGERGYISDGSVMEFALHPRILDIVEQLMGSDIILWQSTIWNKAAAVGNFTPWHQDGDYWPIDPLETLTVWIPTTRITVKNACLRVIPRSHLSRELKPHRDLVRKSLEFSRELEPACYDEADAIDLELDAGQMVLFDVRTVHGARPNDGTLPRTAFAVRYMPSTSFYNHDLNARGNYDDKTAEELGIPSALQGLFSKVPLFLVRGIDRNGRNDFKRNHE